MTFDAPTTEQIAETQAQVGETITKDCESSSEKNETKAADRETPETQPADDGMLQLLEEIYNAEQTCRAYDDEVEDLKEQLKEAKARLSNATNYLRKLTGRIHDRQRGEELDKERPLLNQASGPAATIVGNWRSISTEVLLEEPIERFGAKKKESLLELVPTLGEFEDLRARVGQDAATLRELLPKGIGESAADALEERLISAIQRHQISDDQESQPADESDTKEETPNIEELAESILEDWENKSEPINDREIWRLGYTAYTEEQGLDACCWADGTDNQQDWVIGWLTAYQEDDDPAVDDDDDVPEEPQPEAVQAAPSSVSIDDL